jgi:hypothetical protein
MWKTLVKDEAFCFALVFWFVAAKQQEAYGAQNSSKHLFPNLHASTWVKTR